MTKLITELSFPTRPRETKSLPLQLLEQNTYEPELSIFTTLSYIYYYYILNRNALCECPFHPRGCGEETNIIDGYKL